MGAHAFLSASGSPAWMRCLAKPWRERGMPDESSPDAKEGTAAHFLFEKALEQNVAASHFHGLRILVSEGNETEFHTDGAYPVGPDMTREVQKALDYITKVADGATIYSEQRLSIEHITTEEDAEGTTDTGVIRGRRADIGDLKYGQGVQVFALGNEQLLMYADAFLEEFDILGEVQDIHLHILQPRLDHFDEWVLTKAELAEEIAKLHTTAVKILAVAGDEEAIAMLPAVAGDKQCKFCKVKATCEEYREFVLGAIEGEFENLDEVPDTFVTLDKGFIQVSMGQVEKLLAQSFGVTAKAVDLDWEGNSEHEPRFLIKKPNIMPSLEEAEARIALGSDERLASLMDAADMIEGYARAVRAEVERRLLNGSFTDGRYKLVEGRQGNRAWRNEEEAEKTLKSMRLKVDQMYDFKLISPTTAEKVLEVAFPRKWAKLQDMIHRADGKPSVAHVSDKRPALNLVIAEQFDDLTTEEPAVEPEGFEDLI